MGLFSKKQLLKVIEWEDNTKDTIVYRFPLTDRDAIMNSSTLVVRPSQIAMFIHKGQICDIFAPGTYKLSTENIPLISKILNIPTGGEYTVTAEVYFVNTKQMTGQKWGTQNPIMIRDNDFGNVRIRAFGAYSFKVEDAKKFMEQMFGTNAVYTTSDVAAQIKPAVIESFTDAVAESRISALDLATNYKEFSSTVLATSVQSFAEFGLKLCTFVIENISLPAELEKALDERTKLGMMSGMMGTYTQMKAADAMLAAAENPNGSNMAAMGVGLGAGVGVGGLMMNTVAQAKDAPKQAPAAQGGKTCPKCGASVPAGSKFCPECGEKMPVAKFCKECGAKLADGAKFCPECGTKVE
ncbi:MAG: SPFH domain-containing protein [Bacilli bacterium]|nr:SPFH domain-containing protein [Bacilli bacterium]